MHAQGNVIGQPLWSTPVEELTGSLGSSASAVLGPSLDAIQTRFAELSAGGFRVLGVTIRHLAAGEPFGRE